MTSILYTYMYYMDIGLYIIVINYEIMFFCFGCITHYLYLERVRTIRQIERGMGSVAASAPPPATTRTMMRMSMTRTQANKQTGKQANRQTSRQANKQTRRMKHLFQYMIQQEGPDSETMI